MAKEILKGTDFLGNVLVKGELVAFTEGDSTTLSLGRVLGFTAKSIRVEPIDLPHATSRLSWRRNEKGITRRITQVIRIPNNEDYFKDLPKLWLAKLFEHAPEENKPEVEEPKES